jgi:hypothetical protein
MYTQFYVECYNGDIILVDTLGNKVTPADVVSLLPELIRLPSYQYLTGVR